MTGIIGSQNVKISIIDEDDTIMTLLKAVGFEIPKPELELMLNALRWHKMAKQGLPCPPIDLKMITKFKKDHVDFINEYGKKLHKEALAEQAKEADSPTVVKKHPAIEVESKK